jgi:hypothetical protein
VGYKRKSDIKVVGIAEFIVYLSGMWLVGLREWTPKRHLFKEIGLHAQNMMVILGLENQHHGGGLYDHLLSMRIFTLILSKISIQAPKIMRIVAIVFIWNC